MKELNQWYDQLDDTKRFLVFLAFVNAPVSILLGLYPAAGICLGMALMILRVWPWK